MNPSNPKYAWRELAHQDLPKRSTAERVADFLEIYGLYDEATAREQASRCIQCPHPSCVSGCPLANPIPDWLQLTAEGRFLEAAALLGSVTSLTEICARLCPSDRLCEGQCVLNGVSEPISIRALERFLVEYAFAQGCADTATAPPNGRRVAVVGTGPGALACADELARKGYAITVLDASLVPGGLLVQGLAAFQLGGSVVQRRLDLLKRRGVGFRLGVKVPQDLSLTQLREEFHAVYLGFDSRKARPLDLPGAQLQGVVPAVPFLLQRLSPAPLDLPHMDVFNKRVLVLGAGDTAMDCLRTAIRYGAREAICVYRRGESDMPCSRREYENAREERARFVFLAAPQAVLGNASGQVTGLRLVCTELGLPDETDRHRFHLLPGTEFELQADCIVPALGFEPVPCIHTGDFAALAVTDWGGLVVDANEMTSLPGVFAGGDLVRGPSLVLHAVRDARRAAAAMDRYLSPPVAAPRESAAI